MKEIKMNKDIVITDIWMSVGSMMSFMLKLAFASIPAVLLLTIVVYLISIYVFSMFHG